MQNEQQIKEEWKPSVNPWIMVIPVMLAVFIYVLDGTIGNVALPHMAGSFSATRDESMWILTSYLIAAGIVIPAVDFFSKVFGRKNFFIISIMLFTIASMLCGMAKNIEFMIFARILQGFGGGGILPISQAIMIESFEKSLADIDRILSCAKSSNILRQGIKVAIVGRPNVGKSSLFNTLLNTNRAIVTDIAGTTRDVIKETLDMDVAVTLIDTAGIRDTDDVGKVEEIGIEYSKQSAHEADLIVFVYDASAGMTEEDKEIYALVKHKPHLKIVNKCDLIENRTEGEFYISTATGEGIDELKEQIKNKVCDFSLEDTEYITNERQVDCLEKCRESLTNALNAAKAGELQDLISIDLKSALLFLDEITGEVITDEILNNIFDHFCIGK